MILWKTPGEIVRLQDQKIADCKEFRQEWERNATAVELSYKGIKFPQYNSIKNIFRNDVSKWNPVVNILKRQHRSIQNYFFNNEPAISARRKLDMSFEDLEKSKMLLRRDFVESNFYEEQLDNITNYGLKRWIIYVLALLNENWQCIVEDSDSMDTYTDISAQRKSDIRFYIKTFTKNINEAKTKYKTYLNDNMEAVPLNWDEVTKDLEKTKSDEKRNIIKEPSNVDTILFRHGRYLDYKDWKILLVRVLTIKDKLLQLEEYPAYDFLPVTYYAPINDPDNLYPQSWYLWVLEPERIVNRILSKFVNIVETGWRYVYVREGTKLTKWNNKLLQSIWVEVIEIWKAQELPREVNLLNISQSQMTLLETMIRQAEEEWWMRQDIMWGSSMGSDASWRAIEALQAGSKGNVWMAMVELNKFMNRLAQIFFKLYEKGGPGTIKIYDSWKDLESEIDTKKLWVPKLHIEPRSAFDDITRKMDWIQMLEYIKKFNPETPVPADVIVEIFGIQNDLAEKIDYSMKQQADPDLKAAEASVPLLLQWRRVAVSEDDNHQVHMAILWRLLEQSWKQLPEQLMKNIIDKYNTHKAYMWWDPADDEHRKEK